MCDSYFTQGIVLFMPWGQYESYNLCTAEFLLCYH